MSQPTDQEVSFAPDLFIIPAKIMLDRDLQPLDSKVYGAIYWLERLKDGKCWASNKTIADIVGGSASGVANSLVRLVKQNHIIVHLNKEGHRTDITTQVYMSVNPYSNEEGPLTQMSNIGNKIKESKYTSETLIEIEKIYKYWLVYMIVDPDVRQYGTSDEKHDALTGAQKQYRLTDKRKDAIARRLADAGRANLVRAIKSLSQSPFHRDGIQGNGDQGSWRADLLWLCKSYEKVEEWSNKHTD